MSQYPDDDQVQYSPEKEEKQTWRDWFMKNMYMMIILGAVLIGALVYYFYFRNAETSVTSSGNMDIVSPSLDTPTASGSTKITVTRLRTGMAMF